MQQNFAQQFCAMLKLHFAVAEDEATFLTVMTKGLATEVEVPAGKDLEFAKNRAIDKLCPGHKMFC